MVRVKRVSMVCVLWVLAWPGLAADAGEANRLMIEAVKLIQASEVEPSADGKYKLLKQAHDNLVEIVDRHPSSDLAVKLATGQRVGNVSLSGVREAMERVRVVAPARPGAPIRVWKHEAAVVAVASPSSGGRRVLTASRDGIAALRDIETGRLLGTWQHRSAMTAADLSRNGRRVLTGSRDGVVALREAETGRVLVEWQHRSAVKALALSREGRQAVVGSGRSASVVNVGTVEVVHAWRRRALATSVAYAPDGRWILAGFADGRAVLGDARSGREVRRWKHGGAAVTSAAFSPDGRRILTGTTHWTALLRDVATGRTMHKWKVGSRIRAVAYSRGGRWVLTGADDFEVELHDRQTGRTVRKWRYDSAPPTAVAFSFNDRGALMGFADGTVILCDIRVPERRRGYERTFLTADGGCW